MYLQTKSSVPQSSELSLYFLSIFFLYIDLRQTILRICDDLIGLRIIKKTVKDIKMTRPKEVHINSSLTMQRIF